METLAAWIDAQYGRAARLMRASISAVDVVKARPGFGQEIRAARGSVIATRVLASWDPEPDYFFHWFRDSSVVMDALRVLYLDGVAGDEALVDFEDFLRFSLSLHRLDGRRLVEDPKWRRRIAADFEKFVRGPDELANVRGASVVAETRVNPDGTLDISRWARPQHDGPATRALAVLRWVRDVALNQPSRTLAGELLRVDLAFLCSHWHIPSFDIWEEDAGEHYYTLRLTAAALREGGGWLQTQGEDALARECEVAAQAIAPRLDAFWDAHDAIYRSRTLASGAPSTKELDISVILAAIHAGGHDTAHTVDDERMQSTLARLEAFFDRQYPINRMRDPRFGPALGRYPGDVYFSGGAYFFSTLGAAEFCFRAGLQGDRGSWIAHGDAYLETVRKYTLPDGAMSEQFDQRTGEQTSARHLAWSYAGFITCVAARRAATNGS
jgi:glucoamylase